MGTKVNDIIKHSSIKFILRTNGEPEYTSTIKIVQMLYINEATIPNKCIGGKHGHIGIIIYTSL